MIVSGESFTAFVSAGLPSPNRPTDATCGLPCDDLCVQEGITFRCECNPGRELQSDGISCRGMQEQVNSYHGIVQAHSQPPRQHGNETKTI